MPLCAPCESLRGKLSDTSPHSKLKKTGSSKLTGKGYGQMSGSVFFYICTECGTTWGQDCDSKDPGASWYISKEGPPSAQHP